MTRPLHKRPALLACLLLLFALLVPVLLMWRTWRQVQLDHALIAHIRANDADAVIANLRQGADANAVDTVGNAPSFGQMLRSFFAHRTRKPQMGNRPSA